MKGKILALVLTCLFVSSAQAATFRFHANKTEKATVVGTDLIPIENSASAWATQWIQASTLATYVSGTLPALTIQTSSITTGANNVLGSDYGLIADTDGDGLPNKLDIGAGLIKTDSSGVISLASTSSDYNAYDADIADLADGSLTGSKVSAASSTAVGVSELAIASEIDTGTEANMAVTPDALAGSNLGTKEVGWMVKNSATVTAVADGTEAFVVPASMNGMNLIDLTCAVADLNSAASGTTTTVLRRVRGATAADMTSTGVTIAYNAYSDSDETVDTANDDLATGDKVYVDVNAVTSAVQKGLGCTALFRLP